MTTPPAAAAAAVSRLATVARPAGGGHPLPSTIQTLLALGLWVKFHVQIGTLPASEWRSNDTIAGYKRLLERYGIRNYTPFELYEAYQQKPNPKFTREAYDMIQKEPNLVVLELLKDDEIQQGTTENPPQLFRKCEMH